MNGVLSGQFTSLTLENNPWMPGLGPDTGTVYNGREVEKFLYNAMLRRAQRQNRPLPSSQNSAQPGARQSENEGNDHHDGEDREGDDGRDGDRQPGAAPQSNSSEESTSPTLTITFMGQFDAGKSSLANTVLGFDFFPVKDQHTRKREDDAVLRFDDVSPPQSLRIRSLPGYGSTRDSIQQWIRNNPVARMRLLFLF